MLRATILSALLMFVLLCSPTASAQVCGDANGNGILDIADFTMVIQFLYADGPITNYDNADVDFYRGVTINDLYRLNQWFTFGVPLTCGPDSCYDFRISKEDTVVLPLAQCLRTPTVRLKVVTKFGPTTSGFYLPVELLGQGSTGYSITGVTALAPATSANLDVTGTIGILGGTDFNVGTYSGTLTMFELEYQLTGATPGTITTGPHDLDLGRRFVVRKGSDLYRPVVIFDMQNDYPPGDVTCDCTANLTDLTTLVNTLFVTFTPLVPCPWWPF